jgi:PhnB protein
LHEEQAVRIDPYLYFQGRCDEALEFYRAALGARTELVTRFGDVPGLAGPPDAAGKVMHAVIRIGESTLLATDGASGGAANFQGFSLALSAASDEEAETLFAALNDGGQVQVPMETTPFASRFGIVVDRFGVSWTVVRQAGQP